MNHSTFTPYPNKDPPCNKTTAFKLHSLHSAHLLNYLFTDSPNKNVVTHANLRLISMLEIKNYFERQWEKYNEHELQIKFV